jgi:hypothetical protein
LTITFSRPHGREVVKGPFERVRLEGEVMRPHAGDEAIALHEHHAWRVDGERFTRADCSCPCTLHFARADAATSKSFGPFESISFVDGIAYADRAVFAFADRSVGDWYCHEDERHYPLLVIEPVG